MGELSSNPPLDDTSTTSTQSGPIAWLRQLLTSSSARLFITVPAIVVVILALVLVSRSLSLADILRIVRGAEPKWLAHMGGPLSQKYRYGFNQKGIDCMMVRMIYFVHDVSAEEGAFCVVPGTHKSSYSSPYGRVTPEEEPGMISLPVKAGDAILFTENLRHGGFANRSARTRKTLHVGYGPFWMKSQNIATMEQDAYLLPATVARYDEAQRKLFYARPEAR